MEYSYDSTAHPRPSDGGQAKVITSGAPDDIETRDVGFIESPRGSKTEEMVDLFKPLPPIEGAPEEMDPLTLRCVIIGVVIGSLLCAANMYIGLKAGTFNDGQQFAVFLGFAVTKGLIKLMPILARHGSPFGPKENYLIVSAARAGGGPIGLFINGFPALYQLKLLSDPTSDYAKLLVLTLVCAFIGLFLAVPFRKFFIIDAARDLKIRFPSMEATVLALRCLHLVGPGANRVSKTIKAMGISFTAAFVQKIAADYANGILFDWHIFTWFYIWGNYSNLAINVENWGWFLELTPVFMGIGMLVGLNIAGSLLVGFVLACGLIGPLLVHYGICAGAQAAPNAGSEWRDHVAFTSMSIYNPDEPTSPRYWMLWPGVTVLLCY